MKSFRVKNIKSFVDSGDIEIAPITIFVGKNSCGKSSLIRFPAVLSQTFIADTDSPIKFYGKMLDYGNYEDVLHGHGEGDISFEAKYQVDLNRLEMMGPMRRRFMSDVDRRSGERKVVDATIEVTIGKVSKMLVVKSFALFIDSKEMYRIIKNHGNGNSYVYRLNTLFEDGKLIPSSREYTINTRIEEFDGFFPVVRIREEELQKSINVDSIDEEVIARISAYMHEFNRQIRFGEIEKANEDINELPEEGRLAVTIDNTIDYLTFITVQLNRIMNREADWLSYIGPFRDNPERVYRDQEKKSTFVGTRGENVSTLIINDYHKDTHELIEKISEWLYLSMGYRIAVKDLDSNLFQIMIEDKDGFQSNILDVGYGISQVLPIVAEVFRMQSNQRHTMSGMRYDNRILIVEQPELHLHPAAQADLAELFVTYVGDRSRRLLVETHSEHLIRKLQVCVADPNCPLTKDMVKIYYVDKKNEDTYASIDEMKICEDGRFEKEWPTGFFDKAFDLSMELAEFN